MGTRHADHPARRILANEELPIADAAALKNWRRRLRSTFFSSRLPVARFELPQFSQLKNQTLSALAEEYRNACGCALGGLFMACAAAGSTAAYFLAGYSLADLTLKRTASLLGIVVLAVLCGKSTALIWARWRLIRLAARAHHEAVGAAQSQH